MNTRMNWQNLLSTQRFRPKNGEIVPTVTPSTQEGADALRTDFHIDYDRVVFFRSLPPPWPKNASASVGATRFDAQPLDAQR